MPTEFRIPDASCGHCKSKIETAVTAVDGVRTAEFDLDSKRLTVEHDDLIDAGSFRSVITDIGYTAEDVG